jgi:hypothetical protein
MGIVHQNIYIFSCEHFHNKKNTSVYFDIGLLYKMFIQIIKKEKNMKLWEEKYIPKLPPTTSYIL